MRSDPCFLRRLFALVPCALALAANAATADPVVRASWGDCAPLVVNQDWSGPGSYVQVFSATGLGSGVQTVLIAVEDAALVPAWDFSDGFNVPVACHPASAVTLGALGTSCPPAAVVETRYARNVYLTRPYRGGYFVSVTLDPEATHDPGVRYTLARLAFDHTQSVTGTAGPGQCGGAETPLCMSMAVLAGSSFNFLQQVPMEVDYLKWQGFSAGQCPLAVPSRATTWGQIKSQYH
jgi:hypothetical protein